MTSIENALADNTALGEYLGKDIIRTSVKITKSGDGLSKSLGIAPHVYAQGEELMVLLKVEVGQHIHKPITDTECLELVQEFVAQVATIVTDDASASRLRKQADKIEKAHAAAKGQDRLGDGMDAEDLEPAEESNVTPIKGDDPDLSAFNG